MYNVLLFLQILLSKVTEFLLETQIVFVTWWSKPLIFQTTNIFNGTHNLNYLWSKTLGCKDIGIGKSVAKTQFLSSCLLNVNFWCKPNQHFSYKINRFFYLFISWSSFYKCFLVTLKSNPNLQTFANFKHLFTGPQL